MATPVEAPKLGNTVEECIIAKWFKTKGAAVSSGETIAEIETDKATFELPAPVSGTLIETFFPEGAMVPVFTVICAIGEPGENVEALRPKAAGPVSGQEKTDSLAGDHSLERKGWQAEAPAPQVMKPSGSKVGQALSPASQVGSVVSELVLSPRARRFAEEHGFHPQRVAGSGPGGRVLEDDLRRLYYGTPRTSLAARKCMEEGAEARGEGSGPGGMILSEDLGPPPVRMTGIREKIARRMRESLASTAQYTLNASAGAAGLLALRARIKATPGAPAINIGDMVVFCAVRALLEFPDLNAELIEGRIYRHAHVHVGFACDTPRGLMVPVVRDADKLSAADLAARMKALTAAAVQGNIALDDLAGATFTVSNLGGLGIESFTPLLNPPQVAILGVDAIAVKPVRRDGGIEFLDFIGLSLTCDHQAVDGAPGARFLQVLKRNIENVETLCTI
ncbi:MAG: dihydrolipoamide acetyltransferase family protein [Bryobacteraceae bacterium]|jgi:pyruvate dehydrogenase E2 component (dihydrolipoamide acetyltransferase)